MFMGMGIRNLLIRLEPLQPQGGPAGGQGGPARRPVRGPVISLSAPDSIAPINKTKNYVIFTNKVRMDKRIYDRVWYGLSKPEIQIC